jgi:hypothetical protein
MCMEQDQGQDSNGATRRGGVEPSSWKRTMALWSRTYATQVTQLGEIQVVVHVFIQIIGSVRVGQHSG